MRHFLYTLFVLMLCIWLTPLQVINAQTPCGNIIAPEDIYEPTENIISTPIEDCDDPFGETIGVTSPYTLTVGNTDVSEGDIVEVPEGTLSDYTIDGDPILSGVLHSLYRHDGNDYRQVSMLEVLPTEEEYRAFADAFFEDGVDIEQYVNAIVTLDTSALDTEEEEDLFDDYEQYVRVHFEVKPAPLGIGTYTLVSKEYELILSQTIFQRFLAVLVPTAHAQAPVYPENVFTLTFTITEIQPEPTGASSVLFLPGIQASRLYMKNNVGNENKIWEPDLLSNQEVLQLTMDTNGTSQNDVYTKDILSTLPLGDTVYDSFGRFMIRLVGDGIIKGWTPFAYDWRYSVTDVAENGTRYEESIRDAIDEIEYLASSSYSGKVTIIGHSNGGLLAKAIMQRLEDDGKAHLIDKVVLLASPQLGTPKAIGTILHGYDQERLGGWLIDDVIARGVINNMPGAYGLLPSEKYFEGLTEPIATFTGDTVVNPYRSIYGATISSYAEYVNFINGIDGLERDLDNPASIPARANAPLFNEALAMHATQLDNWTAPDGVEIIEIVGTGLPTMKSAEYRGLVEDECIITVPVNLFCTPKEKIKPYAVLTHYGDETVVQRSAEAYGGDKTKYFVNLVEIKRSFPTTNFKHHNITEVQPLQDLLADILVSTTTESNQFISTSHTEFSDPYDVEIIDSPVRFLATDTSGNQTGVLVVDGVETIKEDIPGSQYFEFGDTKYFVVPKGTNRTTKLYGEDYGGYTLTTAVLNSSDIQTIETILSNATVTPNLIAEYSNTNGTFSTVVTDSNGDGVTDYETTLDGELLIEEVVISYPVLIATIEALNLSKVRKQALLVIIKGAEYYANKTPSKSLYRNLEDGLLKSAQELVKLYVKKLYLTTTDAVTLQEMTQILKDKQ